MEISSEDGAWLRMRPVGYEFDAGPPDEHDEWDDWLVIAGEAGIADGRTWSFLDPCLTTEEARELAKWLQGQSEGDRADTPMLFTEPNIAFRTGPGRPSRRLLDVDFSHESLPPWSPGTGLGRVYSLRLDVAVSDLALAADRWATEIAEFPRR